MYSEDSNVTSSASNGDENSIASACSSGGAIGGFVLFRQLFGLVFPGAFAGKRVDVEGFEHNHRIRALLRGSGNQRAQHVAYFLAGDDLCGKFAEEMTAAELEDAREDEIA